MLSSNMAVGLRRLTWISRAVTRTMRTRHHFALAPRMEKLNEKSLRIIMEKDACINEYWFMLLQKQPCWWTAWRHVKTLCKDYTTNNALTDDHSNMAVASTLLNDKWISQFTDSKSPNDPMYHRLSKMHSSVTTLSILQKSSMNSFCWICWEEYLPIHIPICN